MQPEQPDPPDRKVTEFGDHRAGLDEEDLALDTESLDGPQSEELDGVAGGTKNRTQ